MVEMIDESECNSTRESVHKRLAAVVSILRRSSSWVRSQH